MKQHALVIAIIMIILANTGLVMPVSGIPLTPINNISLFDSPVGIISINATVPDTTNILPVYHGVFNDNGSINEQLQPIFGDRNNVPTIQDAPVIAKTIFESYGGLPADAAIPVEGAQKNTG